MIEFPMSELTQHAIQSECGIALFSAAYGDVSSLLNFWIAAYKLILDGDDRWISEYLRHGIETQISPEHFTESLNECNDLILLDKRFELPNSPAQCVAIACHGVTGFGADRAYVCQCEYGYWGIHTNSFA